MKITCTVLYFGGKGGLNYHKLQVLHHSLDNRPVIKGLVFVWVIMGDWDISTGIM